MQKKTYKEKAKLLKQTPVFFFCARHKTVLSFSISFGYLWRLLLSFVLLINNLLEILSNSFNLVKQPHKLSHVQGHIVWSHTRCVRDQ